MKNSPPDGPIGQPPQGDRPGTSDPAREVDARALMQGAREIVLTLDGEPYRLRITAKQKLILTK